VSVALGGGAIAVPEQRPDDFLAGAHHGVAAAGGMAGAVAGDVADAGLCGEVAIPAIPVGQPNRVALKSDGDAALPVRGLVQDDLAPRLRGALRHRRLPVPQRPLLRNLRRANLWTSPWTLCRPC
jgi:hypothetical protein